MRVVVAGAGIAGLEALIGLHELAGERVALTLLAPVARFPYRPLRSEPPFALCSERHLDLRETTDDLGARFVRDELAYVDADRTRALTRSGDLIPYDALLLAVGAHHPPPPPGVAAWSRGPEGDALLARLMGELERGTARSAAFAVPAGAGWPVDAYELALVAAHRAPGREIVLVTAEQEPLEALGGEAGAAIGDELDAAGVRLHPGVERVDANAADRVVALPVSAAPEVGDLEHDADGFVVVDEHARVAGTPGVFAAGDATALGLKHSTLAAAQGRAAAEAIAAEAGAGVRPEPWSPVLHGIIALPPQIANGSLDGGAGAGHCLWWPPGHAGGRHLAPYIAARDPDVRVALNRRPSGLPVAATVAAGAPASPRRTIAHPSAAAVEHDAGARQLLAVRREGLEGERTAQALESDGAEFVAREHEVIERLRAAGYLRHAGGRLP